MALTKVEADGINLADTFAFTGTVSGAGSIIQVKHMNYDTEQATDATSFVATNITLNITPTSSSNKILAFFTVPIYGAGGLATATLYRDSTDLGLHSVNTNYGFGYSHTNVPANLGGVVLDNPSSTSQLTYTVYHKKITGNSYSCINTCIASLTLMEIASGAL